MSQGAPGPREDLSALLGRRVSRAERLAELVEAEIAAGGLREGHFIGTREELRLRFGVAPATVSEAVRLLEIRGLATTRGGPGGGVFVAGVAERARRTRLILGLDWEQATLMDCLVVRGALEPALFRAAAAEATEADLADLARLVDAMEEGAADPHAYFSNNWEFHRRIARLCANPPLRSMYVTVVDFLEAGMDDFAFSSPSPAVITAHRELIAAMRGQDAMDLERALARHAAASPLAAATPRAD
jgi:DNA-binding FadR family transcriptional regulator